MKTFKLKNILIVLFIILAISNCRLKDGLIETYYPNGNKKVEGYILNNQKHGIWKYYGEDGTLIDEINYKEGKEFGKYIHYCPNSQRINFFYYNDSNENKTGISKSYFCNSGQVRSIFNYSNGVYDSTQIYYYENGQIELIQQYDNGVEIGEWIYFNEKGDTIRIEEYENGNPIAVKVLPDGDTLNTP